MQDSCISDNNAVRPPGDAVSVMLGFVALFVPPNNLPPVPSNGSSGSFLRAVNPIHIFPDSSVYFFKLRLLFSISLALLYFFFSIGVEKIFLKSWGVVKREGNGKADG